MSKTIILHPGYFSPISHYIAISQTNNLLFEVEDNFVKQTFRNRCYINSANGKHLLNIPVQHVKGIKQKTKDVKIDYKYNWNSLHLKTLETAYNSSPFFEFYIDDLKSIFTKKTTYLLDLNLQCNELILEALELEHKISLTTEYVEKFSEIDLRDLINVNSTLHIPNTRYIQVFEHETNFLENLSILDLLFMEGPNALNYLENQECPL